MEFYYVRPDEMVRDWTVTGGADTTYLDEWLFDGRPGRPTRAADVNPSWVASGSPTAVTLLAVINHTVTPGNGIVFGGQLSASLAAPALGAHGIALNPWTLVDSTLCSSVTVAVTSNAGPVIIGEVVMGRARTLERHLRQRPVFTHRYPVVREEAEFDSLLPYDKGLVSRQLRGELSLSDAGLAEFQAWWESTKGGSLMSLIVPDPTKPDALAVRMQDFAFEAGAPGRHRLTVVFDEFPRSRW